MGMLISSPPVGLLCCERKKSDLCNTHQRAYGTKPISGAFGLVLLTVSVQVFKAK